MDFLTGCLETYTCFERRPVIPQDFESLSPFVRVTFGSGSGHVITVGNESAPDFGHEAVITSFEFGQSDGVTAELEILDEQGGSFQHFVDRLIKRMDRASEHYDVNVQWGWVTAGCGGGAGRTIESPKMHFQPLGMSVSFADGKVQYKVTLKDTMQTVFVSRETAVFGSDDHPMPLKQAIMQLMGNSEPKMEVQFLRKTLNGDGGANISTFNFDGGPDYPKGKWIADNQNKLASVMSWISPYQTDQGKGVHATWDATNPRPMLIIWEDISDDCHGTVQCHRNIGTYIVNGGNQSNVISFTTVMNWPVAWARFAVGGGTGGAASGQAVVKDNKDPVNKCDLQPDNVGLMETGEVTENAFDSFGPTLAPQKQADGVKANNKANAINTPGLQAIEAELKIQGDPSEKLCSPKLILYSTLSIIVVNPFHLKGGGSECGDWLAVPGCNQVLSNKNWAIKGVIHSIKNGSYTTTIKVFLVAPGTELDNGSPFGGPGGYVPPD